MLYFRSLLTDAHTLILTTVDYFRSLYFSIGYTCYTVKARFHYGYRLTMLSIDCLPRSLSLRSHGLSLYALSFSLSLSLSLSLIESLRLSLSLSLSFSLSLSLSLSLFHSPLLSSFLSPSLKHTGDETSDEVQKSAVIAEQDRALLQKARALAEKEETIAEKDRVIASNQWTIALNKQTIQSKDRSSPRSSVTLPSKTRSSLRSSVTSPSKTTSSQAKTKSSWRSSRTLPSKSALWLKSSSPFRSTSKPLLTMRPSYLAFLHRLSRKTLVVLRRLPEVRKYQKKTFYHSYFYSSDVDLMSINIDFYNPLSM